MPKQLLHPRGSTFLQGMEGSWPLQRQAGRSLEGKQQLVESQMGIGVLVDMLMQLQLSILRHKRSRQGKFR
jgi:hypothetical protein